MVTFQDTLLLNIKVITESAMKPINRVESRLAMLQKKANLATKLSSLGVTMSKNGVIIDTTTHKFVSQQELMQRMTEQTSQKFLKSTNRMNMRMLGFGLSILFTGMAVKRLGESILKSLVKTYMEATDYQNRFNQELTAVQASFEFLKFSIMDALGNNEMVIGFIEALINMVNLISEFVNKHPQVALFIGTFAVIATILGGIAMTLGQIVLLGVGLNMSFLPLLGTIILIGAFIALLVSLLTIDMKKANAPLNAIKILLLSIGVILLLTLVSPIIALIAYFLLLGVIITKLAIDFGSFGNFFKAILRGLIMALGLVGEAILSFILTPFKAVAYLLIGILELAHKLGKFTNVSTKPLWDFVKSTPVLTGAAELASSIKFDETKGELFKGQGNNVNITVNGDVTDVGLLNRIKEGVEDYLQDVNNRYNGTTTGA